MVKTSDDAEEAKDTSQLMSLVQDSDDGGHGSDYEVQNKNVESDYDSDDGSPQEEQSSAMHKKSKGGFIDKFGYSDSDDGFEMSEDDNKEEDLNEEGESEAEEVLGRLDHTGTSQDKKSSKLKKLTPEQLEKERQRIRKTGVCYLTSIPPYMKANKLRSVLSRFGKIDRIFLKPEDHAQYKKRVKYGGNKKKKFTEGWIEFIKKKDAKLCASTLNGNKLGGKKTSYYYDDVINIKYLKGFKWHDLTQQIATENEIRQAKLTLELSHQQKMNKNFVNNVEQSKMIRQIQKKRSQKSDYKKDDDVEIRRNFKQRKVRTTRADADESLKENRPDETLNGVLSQVF